MRYRPAISSAPRFAMLARSAYICFGGGGLLYTARAREQSVTYLNQCIIPAAIRSRASRRAGCRSRRRSRSLGRKGRQAQQEHTQQDAIGGQGGHSAKRPDWACKLNHFLGQSQSEAYILFLPQKEILPFLLEHFHFPSAIMATRCRRSRQAAPRGQPRCSPNA
jgi:hypothetical protein